jgi:chemotaxis protein methyltransferase CheR
VKTEERRHLIKILRETIYSLTGNYYPDERMKILEYKIERLIKSAGLDGSSPEKIINYFLSSPERKKQLIDLMTVPETRFFREYEQLTALMGGLLSSKKTLDIISIGCSTGEEPYTVAMMMKKGGQSGRVLGTDINERVLEKARRGVYRASVLRDVPDEYREYFTEKDGKVEVVPEIKRMVEFRVLNLINRGDFDRLGMKADCVLCRNVLIYFDSASKRTALENVHSILKREGILVLSSTEILQKEYYDLYESVKVEKYFFFRKRE